MPDLTQAEERGRAEASARVLAKALCNCGKWNVIVPLDRHDANCRYRVEVENYLKENQPQKGASQ